MTNYQLNVCFIKVLATSYIEHLWWPSVIVLSLFSVGRTTNCFINSLCDIIYNPVDIPFWDCNISLLEMILREYSLH